MTDTQKPVHQVRLGTIKAAVWANRTQRNTIRYSVTVQRLYKDKGLWKRTETFRRDDLLLLGKVLDLAHSWIIAQPTKPAAEATPEVGAPSAQAAAKAA
ncbi:MAG: hypothetical protein U0638_12655 [Phycisphaerales bacterium]